MTAVKDPQTVTIQGRMSYHQLTPEEAYEFSRTGKYPFPSVQEAKPSFNVFVEQTQLDKLIAHVENEFIPWAVKRNADGEKKNQWTQADANKVLKDLKKFADATLNVGVKEIPDKSQSLSPESVATVKVTGQKGVAIVKKAIVNSEDELAVPDPSQLTFPVIKPIEETVHDIYPGAIVAVTLNLWAGYNDPKRPMLGIGGSTVVFKADADRFGGGVAVDEDAIFSDD